MKDMKDMKELDINTMTLDQKLGMLMCAHTGNTDAMDEQCFQEALELIRAHSLGCVWVRRNDKRKEEKLAKIHEVADYPIVIVCDAESGAGSYQIGQHGALGMTGSEEHAYTFGKVTGVTARKMGYNMIGDPVVDMTRVNGPCGSTTRCLGGEPDKVSALACAMARGIHDAGVLTMAKHYPGAKSPRDTHMSEGFSAETREDLENYRLLPYLALMKEGLLDAVMTGHTRIPAIDPDHPASLSEKVLGILREKGFDGVMMTDALCMHGVVGKYGWYGCKGLAIRAGNEFILGWTTSNLRDLQALREAYDSGIITPERLDQGVRRVLALQHKVTLLPQDAEITPEDERVFRSINTDGVAAITDPGVSVSIDPNGKHFFVLLEENLGLSPSDNAAPTVDTFRRDWYRPDDIERRIREYFPASDVMRYNEFPTSGQNIRLLDTQLDYDDVVFVTFYKTQAYVGRECFTSRVIDMIEALQVTSRVSTIVHLGNPFLLEETVHIPRRICASGSYETSLSAIDVLAGRYPAKGEVPFTLKLV